MTTARWLLGGLGIALLGYGSWRIFEFSAATQPEQLGIWLAAALVLHDGILSWLVVGIGWLLARFVPGRARGYLQGGLITAGLVSLVAAPLIYRRGRSQPGQALLERDYLVNLLIIAACIAAVTATAYLVRVRRETRVVKARPPADQTSTG
ncbi:hypothetical protein [Jatrophihabitans sp.]|uniref:hypothetical protein n=1 Tax=Jatrophihabitans sp. TaxID=1932789 RepID=UPI002C3B779D|nr:hypothetical protein [Jatrophihabitans sp.]